MTPSQAWGHMNSSTYFYDNSDDQDFQMLSVKRDIQENQPEGTKDNKPIVMVGD